MNGEKNIRLLIGKFMQGLTSIEEEERISQWFAVHADVSDDLKPYQQMFAYFDKGMPMDGPMPEDGETSDGGVCREPLRYRSRLRPLCLLACCCRRRGSARGYDLACEERGQYGLACCDAGTG